MTWPMLRIRAGCCKGISAPPQLEGEDVAGFGCRDQLVARHFGEGPEIPDRTRVRGLDDEDLPAQEADLAMPLSRATAAPRTSRSGMPAGIGAGPVSAASTGEHAGSGQGPHPTWALAARLSPVVASGVLCGCSPGHPTASVSCAVTCFSASGPVSWSLKMDVELGQRRLCLLPHRPVAHQSPSSLSATVYSAYRSPAVDLQPDIVVEALFRRAQTERDALPDAREAAPRGTECLRRPSTGAPLRSIGRRLSSVGTLAMNGIDVRRWLHEWLEACARNGSKAPDDLEPWLPWSMSPSSTTGSSPGPRRWKCWTACALSHRWRAALSDEPKARAFVPATGWFKPDGGSRGQGHHGRDPSCP